MELSEISNELIALEENVVLVYAFNATGKTRLSVSYKDETKRLNDGNHAGVYYNAFSEDLFVWDNDEENHGENICLKVQPSTLSKFHSLLTEEDIYKKLEPYKPEFDFKFETSSNPEDGIQSISFFVELEEQDEDGQNKTKKIKISRGEERIFVWCFFLALFEVEGWADEQSKHFFIDDPVSSLDDHNIFVTAVTLFDLIEKYFKERKIVITTHHIGLFSILYNWLNKGEKASMFKKRGGGSYVKSYMLNRKDDNIFLDRFEKSVFLYHLHLLQKLKKAQEDDELYGYHFVLLRQVLENIASFLGVGQFAYVLQQIGIADAKIPNMINVLSHKNIFYYESDTISPANKNDLIEILNGLFMKYNFHV